MQDRLHQRFSYVLWGVGPLVKIDSNPAKFRDEQMQSCGEVAVTSPGRWLLHYVFQVVTNDVGFLEKEAHADRQIFHVLKLLRLQPTHGIQLQICATSSSCCKTP